MPWWNRKKYGGVCPITQTRLRHGKNKYGLSYSVFLSCKHGFNRRALMMWVLSNHMSVSRCPICRKEFDSLLPLL